MSKGLTFTILLFTALVAFNYLFSLAANILPTPPIMFPSFPSTAHGQSYITQGYGRTPYSYLYPGNWHNGIDIAAAYGAPIYSLQDGVVIATGNQDDYCYRRGFGKYIAVKDPVKNLVLWYGHLGMIKVSPGQNIAKGTEVGTVGATGLETGAHLHFSIFNADGFMMKVRNGCGPEPTGQDLNPLNYL